MRRCLLALLLAGLSPVLGADAAGQLLGTWSPANDRAAVIALTPGTQGRLVGHLVAHAEHPDHIGTQVFRELRYDPDTARWQGEIYSARLDKWFDARLNRLADNGFTVEIKTWIFTRSVEWVRVPDPRETGR